MNCDTTVGFDFSSGYYKLYDGTLIHLKIWDTPGQEVFKSIISNYVKRADIVFLVYDITDESSFYRCKYYQSDIKEESKIFLLGNKNDCEEKRKVSYLEGYNCASENNYIFIETSCKENINVYEIFENAIIEAHLTKKKKE